MNLNKHKYVTFVLHKKVVRVLTGSAKLEHCNLLFVMIKCLNVINLYIYRFLSVLKIILLAAIQERYTQHNTRNSNKVNVPYNGLSKSLNSYDVIGCNLFNKLPSEWTCLPLNSVQYLS